MTNDCYGTVTPYTVLWIRIFWLSWIRIRIGNADPDPVRAIVYDFFYFFAYSFEGTFTSFFKKSKRNHKTVGIKDLLKIFAS